RHDEAREWFARARTILEEQGARPLRAIADFDEAVMYQRRAAPGDRERALALLDLARRRFEDLGIDGMASPRREGGERARIVIAAGCGGDSAQRRRSTPFDNTSCFASTWPTTTPTVHMSRSTRTRPR